MPQGHGHHGAQPQPATRRPHASSDCRLTLTLLTKPSCPRGLCSHGSLPKALGSNQTWRGDAQDMSEQHVESLFRDLDMNGTGAIEIEDFELAILGRVGVLGSGSVRSAPGPVRLS